MNRALGTVPSKPRIGFIDLARALAILFAMTSHIFIEVNMWQGQMSGEVFLLIKSITRTATPMFIILFGVMLEVVYYQQFLRNGKFRNISQRLLSRAMICYLGVGFIGVFALITAKIDLPTLLQAVTYTGPGRWGEILKYYSIAMLIAPMILWLRHRFGLLSLILLLIAVWSLSPILHMAFAKVEQPHYLFSYLLGIGNKIDHQLIRV